ncbi:MAG: twin transmembrane helix small protein [Candidatus Thiodiazotropha sp.]|nr:twin transmembrane helix small protein [Candidatus Thiodiazotropha sp.]MCU7803883.1 twin transmembrane helix small protein [Candidatus Thiodiazotropha sp. (ex Lucinoma borealis)]MCU7839102.1 twin transmembrane helix small protein [Candidatus Thiodiazotropha sp. (ex Troendleina suluensis)]MCU7886369.1 twin transmembrane helix small protein [Candidatus Thiodiazotropha sp. (ex Lucinoma annulata)]MCM8884732.1 twin transmembrane helix small protein [Candidatus Thiodiazotropha sp.]
MDIIFKLPVLLVLLFILFSLFQGMYFMAKDDGRNNSTRVVRALTIRVALSLLLFIILMAGYYFGLLQPHGILPQ